MVTLDLSLYRSLLSNHHSGEFQREVKEHSDKTSEVTRTRLDRVKVSLGRRVRYRVSRGTRSGKIQGSKVVYFWYSIPFSYGFLLNKDC